MKLTYLYINFFTIILPFIWSFEARLHFYKKWKFYFPGMIVTAIFFLVWDYFKTKYGVWGFNDQYIIGLKFWGLPLEEILFFITVPYSCTFIYEAVSTYISSRVFPVYLNYLLWALSVIAFVSSFLVMHLAYTFSVLFLIGIVMPIAMLVLKGNRLDKFVLMYLISLIPMAVVNGFLTALPVVIYDNTQNLGIRAGTIPIEDFVYSAILLVMNVGLYEWRKTKI